MVKRYDLEWVREGHYSAREMVEHDGGEWLRHSDHLKALEAARREARLAAIEEVARGFYSEAREYERDAAHHLDEDQRDGLMSCAQDALFRAWQIRDMARLLGPEGGSCAMDNDDLNDGLDPMEVEG